MSNGVERFKTLLLRYLSEPSVDELVEHHTALTFSKGAAIFRRGAPADVVYWIRAGIVDVLWPGRDGNAVLARLIGAGEFLGYADFIDEKGRRCQAFDAHARTTCQLALVTREHLERILQKLDASRLVRVLEQFNTAWSGVLCRWACFIGLDYRQRLELVLGELASRFGLEDAGGVLLLPRLSHADFAEMIGSSRPMVSRILSEMADRKLLFLRDGHFIIARGSGLEAASSARAENKTNVCAMPGAGAAMGYSQPHRQSRVASNLEATRRGGCSASS
ncbi:MAG: Crp/Fnr family transcriptional regulator [Candidatus Binataceae bacterium]